MSGASEDAAVTAAIEAEKRDDLLHLLHLVHMKAVTRDSLQLDLEPGLAHAIALCGEPISPCRAVELNALLKRLRAVVSRLLSLHVATIRGPIA